MTINTDKKTRKLEGVVVSDKMAKTVVVSVLRVRKAEKYGKQFIINKKFKAHDEKNAYHVGDRVIIEQTRPLSKEKNWRVTGKLL